MSINKDTELFVSTLVYYFILNTLSCTCSNRLAKNTRRGALDSAMHANWIIGIRSLPHGILLRPFP
jgi:hypothetical protein